MTLADAVGGNATQTDNDQGVEDGDQCHGTGKTEHEAVPNERFVGWHESSMRPAQSACQTSGGSVSTLNGRGVQHGGQHGQYRRRPDTNTNHTRDDQRPVVMRRHRPAHRHVAVNRHHRQNEHRRKPVDWRRREEQPTDDVAKYPALQDGRGDEDGQTDEKTQVGDSQVSDVEIRDGLGLGVASYDNDDARVTNDAANTDQQMNRWYDCSPAADLRCSVFNHVASGRRCIANVTPQAVVRVAVVTRSHRLTMSPVDLSVEFSFFFITAWINTNNSYVTDQPFCVKK